MAGKPSPSQQDEHAQVIVFLSANESKGFSVIYRARKSSSMKKVVGIILIRYRLDAVPLVIEKN